MFIYIYICIYRCIYMYIDVYIYMYIYIYVIKDKTWIAYPCFKWRTSPGGFLRKIPGISLDPVLGRAQLQGAIACQPGIR